MNRLNPYCKLIIFPLILFNFVGLPAYGDSGKICTDADKIKIEAILKKMNVPSPVVLGIAQSPLPGICEIGAEIQGAVRILYTNSSFDYILFGGNLIETKAMVNLTAKSVQNIKDRTRIDVGKIYLNEDLVIGDKGAAKKVIVFTDPD